MDQADYNEIFDKLAFLGDLIVREASVMTEAVDYIQDSDIILRRISSLESDGDDIIHSLKRYYKDKKLAHNDHALFLMSLISLAEDCTDVFEDLAMSFNSYNITSLREDVVPMLVAMETSADAVSTLLVSLRAPDEIQMTQRALIEINHNQYEAMEMASAALRNLFANEKDPIEVIRWKEIYVLAQLVFEKFEDLADRCEDYLLFRA